MTATANPYPTLKAAALGETRALLDLAQAGCRMAATDGDFGALFEALVFARLAYARTCGVGEASVLLCCLAVGQVMAEADNDVELETAWQGEAIALLSALADAGVQLAEDELPAVVALSTPAATARAQQLREMMRQGE